MRKQIEKALEEIRPMIQEDGGDVQLVEIDEARGIVTVELQGACVGCPLSQVTLKAGIEKLLKERVKGISCVEAV